MHVPKSPLRTLWVAAGHVQLEDNALISSLRAGDAHLAVRPRLSVTSMPLLHPLCLPTWFQPIPDETHYTWTWQLVHQPLWACRIWPQSRGNPMRWQWAGQISHDCQIRVRSGSVCQSPKNSSFLWSSSQVSGYLSEMAAVGCSSLSLLGTAERFVEALQDVCECGPGCLLCHGGSPQQKAQPFCQGKLGNLCLCVARGGRYLLVWA